MGDDRDLRGQLLRAAARLGMLASAFLVFAAGWYGMRSGEPRRVVLLAVLAVAAAAVASAFSRRIR